LHGNRPAIFRHSPSERPRIWQEGEPEWTVISCRVVFPNE
jgi:hypothetical protein